MEEKHTKLRVKVGDAEFEGEGPAELIGQQYKDFLSALAPLREAKPPSSAGAGVTLPPKDAASDPLGEEVKLKRVFAENDAVISLLALPKGDTPDADAILLLVYGYSVLRKNDYPVTGVRLMQCAKQSGLHQVDRIDRIIATHAQYVNSAGLKRGKKYSLNNQGLIKAYEILNNVLA